MSLVTDPSNPLLVEKYRPKRIQDTILPPALKKTFTTYVESGDIPNLLLVGGPGVGKTTVAKAMLHEVGADFIEINGSLSGDIGTLRNEIQNFASTVSFGGGRKFVILDEADYLNANSTQPALRNFMEAYSLNCGFIMTANYKNRIIEPLHSRLSIVDFTIKKKEVATLGVEFLARLEAILQNEGIEYSKEALVALISKYFPDWRKVLNEIQRYSAIGPIDSGILVDMTDEIFKVLIKHMIAKNFTQVRKWIGEHEDVTAEDFYRRFYDQASNIVVSGSIPQLVLHLANYQDKEARVADTQINRAAFAVECMADLEFKE